jgi:hypothetical protein
MRKRVCTVTFALLVAVAVTVVGAGSAQAQSIQAADFGAALLTATPNPAPAETPAVPSFVKPSLRGANFFADPNQVSQATGAEVRQGFGVFFLVGPMFDKFSSDDDEVVFENQTGLQLSLGLGGNMSGFFGVGTEFTLLRRKFDEGVTAQTFQVPLLFYLNGGCHRINCFNFHVIFGPAFDLVMSTDGISIDDIERYQIDIIVGGMVEVARFMFQVRYVQGIRAVNKEFDEFGKIKTKTFVLLFGIRLN